jgi:hypothetical protein
MKTFYVGERPGGSTRFRILSEAGVPESLASYTQARVLMLDSDNREVEFPNENTEISDPIGGVVTFLWPSESVFKKAGYYVLQVELIGASATRKTSVLDIHVKRLGGVK